MEEAQDLITDDVEKSPLFQVLSELVNDLQSVKFIVTINRDECIDHLDNPNAIPDFMLNCKLLGRIKLINVPYLSRNDAARMLHEMCEGKGSPNAISFISKYNTSNQLAQAPLFKNQGFSHKQI